MHLFCLIYSQKEIAKARASATVTNLSSMKQLSEVNKEKSDNEDAHDSNEDDEGDDDEIVGPMPPKEFITEANDKKK